MEKVLQQRRESLQHEIDNLNASMKETDKELSIALKKGPQRPCSERDAERMETEIAELEYYRQTTSMKLNDEKDLIKKIDSMKKTIGELSRFQDFDVHVQAMKKERDECRTKLKAKRTELGEVRHAQRILSASTSLGVPVEELKVSGNTAQVYPAMIDTCACQIVGKCSCLC